MSPLMSGIQLFVKVRSVCCRILRTGLVVLVNSHAYRRVTTMPSSPNKGVINIARVISV